MVGEEHGIPRLRDYQGPALLSYGFRPFFLFGSLYAGLAVLAWLPMLNGQFELASGLLRATGMSTRCSTASCLPS